MNNDVILDSLRLVKNILNSLLPEEKGAIVNIARDKRDSFQLKGIATTYGYKQDKTPVFLEKHGVIEAKNIGKWHVENVDSTDDWVTKVLPVINFVDPIYIKAIENDYLEGNKIPKYYYEATYWGGIPSIYSWGPNKVKHTSVLINVDALRKFKDEFEIQENKSSTNNGQKTNIVTFDDSTGSIKIDGIFIDRIRKNTDQFELCSLVLKNESSKKKKWEWEVVLNKWHMGNINDLSDKKMKVYRAAREVNNKIAKKSEYKEFFLYTTNTVQLNTFFR